MISAAIGWAAKLLGGPAGALLGFVKAIYDAVRWFLDNAERIKGLIKRVKTTFQDLVRGASISSIAENVKDTLGDLIAPTLDAIAKFLDLGSIPGKIRGFLTGVRESAENKILKLLKIITGPFSKKRKSRKESQKGYVQLLEAEEWTEDRENKKETHELWVETDGKTVKLKMASEKERDVEDVVKSAHERLKRQNASGANIAKEKAEVETACGIIQSIREWAQKIVNIFKRNAAEGGQTTGKGKTKGKKHKTGKKDTGSRGTQGSDAKKVAELREDIAKAQEKLGEIIIKIHRSACPVSDGSCFVDKTLLQCDHGLLPIKNADVEHWAITTKEDAESPAGSGTTKVDPKTWRKVFLTLDKPNGGRVKAKMLRDPDWFAEHGAEVGKHVYLKMPEMGSWRWGQALFFVFSAVNYA